MKAIFISLTPKYIVPFRGRALPENTRGVTPASVNKLYNKKKSSLRKSDRIVESLKKELCHPYITSQGLAHMNLSEGGHRKSSTVRNIDKMSDD
tara:strand:- start:828 stop:1109 length:282 start_codon:yes stop_codon:yes gene_type:complete